MAKWPRTKADLDPYHGADEGSDSCSLAEREPFPGTAFPQGENSRTTFLEGENSPVPTQHKITSTTLLEEKRREMKLALYTYHTSTARRIHADKLAEESIANNPLAFSATLADEDTMYLHQAQKQADWKQFNEAMVKEINDHSEGKHWEVIDRDKVPKGHKIVRGVWSMKRKRRVKYTNGKPDYASTEARNKKASTTGTHSLQL